MNKTAGLNTRKKRKCHYIETTSALRPQPHYEHHLIPLDEETEDDTENDDERNVLPDSFEPHLITQSELNDLVRVIDLSKVQAELLGSRLKQ